MNHGKTVWQANTHEKKKNTRKGVNVKMTARVEKKSELDAENDAIISHLSV